MYGLGHDESRASVERTSKDCISVSNNEHKEKDGFATASACEIQFYSAILREVLVAFWGGMGDDWAGPGRRVLFWAFGKRFY